MLKFSCTSKLVYGRWYYCLGGQLFVMGSSSQRPSETPERVSPNPWYSMAAVVLGVIEGLMTARVLR
jgi:hypothetical protein